MNTDPLGIGNARNVAFRELKESGIESLPDIFTDVCGLRIGEPHLDI